jgi:hypothetical protein
VFLSYRGINFRDLEVLVNRHFLKDLRSINKYNINVISMLLQNFEKTSSAELTMGHRSL